MSTPRRGEAEIASSRLEPLPNPHPATLYIVRWTWPEFTCKCPISGYPDFASIRVWFVPDQTIIELKSLKLYFNAYRDSYGFHENTTNTIVNDLVAVLHPTWLRLEMDWSPRGNLHTLVLREHQPANAPDTRLLTSLGGRSRWGAADD